MWISAIQPSEGPRLALTECPVSYVTGESEALLEDFRAHLTIPSSNDLLAWPARRVDAFAWLWRELRKMENAQNA